MNPAWEQVAANLQPTFPDPGRRRFPGFIRDLEPDGLLCLFCCITVAQDITRPLWVTSETLSLTGHTRVACCRSSG